MWFIRQAFMVAVFGRAFCMISIGGQANAQPVCIYSLQACKLIYKADSFHKAGKHRDAVTCANELLRTNPQFIESRSISLRLFYFYKSINRDSAKHYLFQALTRGINKVADYLQPVPRSILEDYTIFDDSTNSAIRRIWASNNITCLDDSMVKLLHKLKIFDQAARHTQDSAYLAEFARYDSVISSPAYVDSVNLTIIKPIVHRYGWPGYRLLGFDGDQDLWILVQHADKEPIFQQSVLQLIEANVRQNNTNKRNYAYLYDRVCVNTGVPQLFGTQLANVTSDSLQIYPLQDPSNVDYYRYTFNLVPLEEYKKYCHHHFCTHE